MRRIAVVLALAWTSRLPGQYATGRVIDSATATSIPRVNVTLLDGQVVVARQRTDDSGRFVIRAPKQGAFRLQLRIVGFAPRTTPVTIGDASTLVIYRLARLPVALDTVVTKEGKTLFQVTPGRVLYQQHLLLNRGQMVAGLEIQHSNLTAVEYLGTIPGFRFVTTIGAVAPRDVIPTSPPTIPGKNGFLLSTFDSKCLYGRIDHWSIIGLLDNQLLDNVDDLISADDIMGVELYETTQEIPADYRGAASVKQLVWRTEWGGRDYLIGDTGSPPYPRFTIDANPKDGPARPPLPSVNPRPPSGVRAPGVSRTAPWGVFSFDSLFDRPPSFALPSMSAPHCGFVQIWTRIAW